ncbi:hypothetical protein [Mesorhizobium sp. ORS 3428]|uniref:hypothetical protein n=1 Tax=Mesorhizobium sp. ORS 3428 TaxID=540997 RepID=UPI0008DAFA56|nr:hypothetical protein [Mesorhizobium sp. ORS 3428]OHV88581.1 hypothetical protein ORS3428_18685 [Mesorhizobium sp. ORS 3428]
METYGELVSGLVDWATDRSGAILVLSATLPLALLLREGWLVACGVLGVFVGAVMLVVFGIESTVAAALVVLASSLLFSTVLLSIRKRLAQIEDRVASVASAIDKLEIAEERRQTFSTRRPPHNSRILARLQSVAGAAEYASGAAAEAERETPAFPGLYSQEPGATLEFDNSARGGSGPLRRRRRSSQ